jgi:hypothetical protein
MCCELMGWTYDFCTAKPWSTVKTPNFDCVKPEAWLCCVKSEAWL